MDFLELAKKRYSVRHFTDEKLPEDVIGRIVEAGLVAPTACNKQPQKIIVVNTDEGLTKLKKCSECHYNCKTAIIVCYDEKLCWQRSYDNKSSGDIDASIVTTHMMLQACEEGVGSTWVMYFIPDAIKAEFELEKGVEPVAILVLGYPDEESKPSNQHIDKKRPEEIVIFK